MLWIGPVLVGQDIDEYIPPADGTMRGGSSLNFKFYLGGGGVDISRPQ